MLRVLNSSTMPFIPAIFPISISTYMLYYTLLIVSHYFNRLLIDNKQITAMFENCYTMKYSHYFKDIRFWIILFFIVRLYGIFFPPLEVSHNWRQTTVTMVARNFSEEGANLLYPKIDIAGEKSGITGMEFPVLNYLIYLVSFLFGYEHWYGRLINLIVSSFGIWYFYRLIKKYFKEDIAFNASIVLLFSIWYTYSRKIMPDTFSMSLMIAGLYYALNYLDEGKTKDLIPAFLLVIIGTLAKLPSAYLLTLLALPYLSRNFQLNRKLWLGSLLGIGLIFPLWFYFKWVPYLETTFGFHHFFMGKSMATGTKELIQHWPETLSKFYDIAIKYIAFAFLLWGLFKAIRTKETLLLRIFFIGFIGFLPIMLKGGFTFYHHSYYIIPFVPVMALMSAYGISLLPSVRWTTIVLVAIGLEGFFNHLDDFRIKPVNKAVLQLEPIMDVISQPKDLVAINSGAFPTPMYFAHRKGWVEFNDQLSKSHYIDSLSQLGLRHIIIMKRTFGDSMHVNSYKHQWFLRYRDINFDIYSIDTSGLNK